MKRKVKILSDGTPETITLPRAEQFIHGMFTDGRNCGCLFGHAYYAFGVELDTHGVTSSVPQYLRAVGFANEVCVELMTQLDLAVGRGSYRDFDRMIEDAVDYGEHGGAANVRKRVAHAWRVVASRAPWNYDVNASEPDWRP